MGISAEGDGLRERDELLAKAEGLAAGGGVGPAAPGAFGPAGRGRTDRLVAGQLGRGVRAGAKRGAQTGPNPTDRGKSGTRHHVLVERGGLPLAALIGPANAHDSLSFAALLDAVPRIRRHRGGPRCRPAKLHADKGYDFERCRRAARQRHIRPRIARRGIESTQRLGRHRWVVERTLSWLHRHRRLRIRYERRCDIHHAFLSLSCSLLCFHHLHRFC